MRSPYSFFGFALPPPLSLHPEEIPLDSAYDILRRTLRGPMRRSAASESESSKFKMQPLRGGLAQTLGARTQAAAVGCYASGSTDGATEA